MISPATCPRCGFTFDPAMTAAKKNTTEAPMTQPITEIRDAAPRVFERRDFAATEVRVERKDGKTYLVGHAAVFNSDSKPLTTKAGKRFIERIQPGAFKDALATNPDIVMLRDHDPKQVLSRTKAKTLAVNEDERGLSFRAELPDTTAAKDTVADVEHGNIPGVSFGFGEPEDSWDMNGDVPVRTLLKIPLGEISPTPFPAYEATDISVRADEAIARLAAGETNVRCYGMGERSDHEHMAEQCRSMANSMHEMCHRAHEMHLKENRSFTDDEMRSFGHAEKEMQRCVRRVNELRAFYRDAALGDAGEPVDGYGDGDADGITGKPPAANGAAGAEMRSEIEMLTRQLQIAENEGLPTDDLRAMVTAKLAPPPIERIRSIDDQFYVMDESGEKRIAGPYKFKMQAAKRLKRIKQPPAKKQAEKKRDDMNDGSAPEAQAA